jgi:hypothetical protein
LHAIIIIIIIYGGGGVAVFDGVFSAADVVLGVAIHCGSRLRCPPPLLLVLLLVLPQLVRYSAGIGIARCDSCL